MNRTRHSEMTLSRRRRPGQSSNDSFGNAHALELKSVFKGDISEGSLSERNPPLGRLEVPVELREAFRISFIASCD
jgi:hypothetical protein